MNKESLREMSVYIERHITENISLDEIGCHVKYSPYYCSASFKKYKGTSIKDYIRKRRLHLAAEELRESEGRIIDIALKYCYSSQEAFSRAFTNYFGISPFDYRRGKLPIMSFYMKNVDQDNEKEKSADRNDIVVAQLQNEITEQYPVNVLHVLNGMCMLEDFREKGHFKENATYIPFNEAMCWGRVTEEIFSETFIDARVTSLNTTKEDYQQIVMKHLESISIDDFSTIVLWFGSDMFCQINMLTVMAYLEQKEYQGDVLFCMKNEVENEMLPEAYGLDISGSMDKYIQILCRRKMPVDKMLPVLYQAASMYLKYDEENSEIFKYISKHIGKERNQLIRELLCTFPSYGLGDLQYDMMIERFINRGKNS